MSVTIGFGFPCASFSSGLWAELQQCADQCGYRLSLGYDLAECEVREGITTAAATLGWGQVALLHAPATSSSPIAFSVEEELRNCLSNGENHTNIIFLRFLTQLNEILKLAGKQWACLFASEWYSHTQWRQKEGTLENLVRLLEEPGNWNLLLFDPIRNAWQENDDYPLVYLVGRSQLINGG